MNIHNCPLNKKAMHSGMALINELEVGLTIRLN